MQFEEYKPDENEGFEWGKEKSSDPWDPIVEAHQVEEIEFEEKIDGLPKAIARAIREDRDLFISQIAELTGVVGAEDDLKTLENNLKQLTESPDQYYESSLETLESYIAEHWAKDEEPEPKLNIAAQSLSEIVQAFKNRTEQHY